MTHHKAIPVTAVGALLAAAAPALAQAPAEPTFARDVAPILQRSCQECHRVGSMAPMSLVTYEEVRPWARAIRGKVVERVMPPWHIDKTVGIREFSNDISLSDAEIDTVARWVDAGAPLGDPADLPPPIEWPAGDVWRLSEKHADLGDPDVVIRSTPWTQPAEGQDQWHQPVVPTGVAEDRWVRALELRPSMEGRSIVHHVLTYLLQEEERGADGAAVDEGELGGVGTYFTEYAVGKLGDVFREDSGKLLRPGSRVRYDIHYHSVGEEITDSTELGIWLLPRDATPKYRVFGFPIGVPQAMQTLDIPPGAVTQHEAFEPIRRHARIENFQPHMHLRGKAMAMEAIYPDGRIEMLNYVGNFDFNWHVNYVYTEDSAPVLPAGTIIKLTAWHDNTAANRGNPDPTQWVGWGQRTVDDMFHAHVNMVYLDDEDYERIVAERSAARAANDDD